MLTSLTGLEALTSIGDYLYIHVSVAVLYVVCCCYDRIELIILCDYSCIKYLICLLWFGWLYACYLYCLY